VTTPQAPPPGDAARPAGHQAQEQAQQPGQEQAQQPGQERAREPAGHELEEGVPGLAQERTSLAWTRTAISFAALGGVVLKANVITGLIILAVAPVVWQLGRVTRGGAPARGDQPPTMPVVGAARLFAIAVSTAAVALLCLVIAIFGTSVPGALR
jgi:uncharacterized membrane protein YidH (DUF202 family)